MFGAGAHGWRTARSRLRELAGAAGGQLAALPGMREQRTSGGPAAERGAAAYQALQPLRQAPHPASAPTSSRVTAPHARAPACAPPSSSTASTNTSCRPVSQRTYWRLGPKKAVAAGAGGVRGPVGERRQGGAAGCNSRSGLPGAHGRPAVAEASTCPWQAGWARLRPAAGRRPRQMCLGACRPDRRCHMTLRRCTAGCGMRQRLGKRALAAGARRTQPRPLLTYQRLGDGARLLGLLGRRL